VGSHERIEIGRQFRLDRGVGRGNQEKQDEDEPRGANKHEGLLEVLLE
jgi:hypothetical protein